MGRMKFRFDDAALNAYLVELFKDKLGAEAAAIASDIKAEHPDLNVISQSGIGDNGRPYGLVTIAEPHGLQHQAKHGTLTRAAAKRGIETRRT